MRSIGLCIIMVIIMSVIVMVRVVSVRRCWLGNWFEVFERRVFSLRGNDFRQWKFRE
jgi:hypothetical protein